MRLAHGFSIELAATRLGDIARAALNRAVRGRLVTLHHLACSGGTIMTKCLATMPSALVLSEIHPDRKVQANYHPLSQVERGYSGQLSARQRRAIRDHFRREMTIAHGITRSLDRQLIVRDHAHVDFAWRRMARSRLVEVLAKDFELVPIVTIRDPREVWLSVRRQNWFAGTPDDLCKAHLALLDAFPDAPVFRYEDFVNEPENIVHAMCEAAGIPFLPGFEERLAEVKHMTGDSGRSGAVIEPRPPRPLSDEDRSAFENSTAFGALMDRMGYAR